MKTFGRGPAAAVALAAVALAAVVLAAVVAGCGTGGTGRTGSSAGTSSVHQSAGSSPTTPARPSVAPPSRSSAAGLRPAVRATGAEGVPHYDHILVVVEENKPYGELVGTSDTPFLTALASSGAVLTQSYAITHPSEPNYLALFSGSTQGLSSDSCPHQFSGPDLAAALIASGHSFIGYSESLPEPGYTGCSAGSYARKHAPWVNFALPISVNQPLTALPADFNRLPDVSFVIPNLDNDMHDGSIAQGDQWLSDHLGNYRTWATNHHSLLVVTTDEDDNGHDNHITTILAGARVRAGQYPVRVDHYGLLRTLLDSFDLSPFAGATSATAISGVWSR